ncbi:sulfite exporter TauE/SafE family protein [Sulfitobacter sp. NAS-14.1]|uniref:sulfite exporter TauE/SafE family protein n=1 Tax=Sulfitobacter TaxID=60136 RepID=UPI0003247495|nr:sulfite exporter TauE/SafE family protein [Sulfitobacter sp. NAS-14.1]
MIEQLIYLTGLSVSSLAVAMLLIFAGAYLKGFTGFGASMFWVTSLSFILPPVQVVPMVLIFEVVTSIVLLPSIWSQVRWNSILWLFLGTSLATPIGIYALASLPADPVRLALALTVLIAAILILTGFQLSYEPGKKMTFAVGGIAGILNGSMGIVGPPVILFYFSTPIGIAAGRASIIAFFVGTDTVGTVLFAAQGLLTSAILWRTLIFLPVLVVGVVLGGKGYVRTSEEAFKKVALYVLVALSIGLGLQVFI